MKIKLVKERISNIKNSILDIVDLIDNYASFSKLNSANYILFASLRSSVFNIAEALDTLLIDIQRGNI